MEQEKLMPWFCNSLAEPIMLIFEKIFYGTDGMKIFFRKSNDDKSRILLHFRDLPAAVRIVNESQRLVSLLKVPKDVKHSFYIVENSQFISWVNSESYGIYQKDPLFHLAIITDEWIDLICNEEPEIIFEMI